MLVSSKELKENEYERVERCRKNFLKGIRLKVSPDNKGIVSYIKNFRMMRQDYE